MDDVDEAIAAVENGEERAKKAEAEARATMAQHDLRIDSSGKHFVFLYPVDITDAEVHEVVAWLLMGFPQVLAQVRGDPRSRIILPRQ